MMVLLKTISTGSKGNAYALDVNGEILLIECGMKFKDVLKSIDYKAGNVVGALCSHIHSDHSKYISQFESYGIEVFKPYETEERIKCYGKFKVQAIEVPHDGVKCFGFYIWHPTMGVLVYLTDLEYCPVKFPGANYFMVECNYMDEFVNSEDRNYDHRMKGHFSLENCCNFVAVNIHLKCKKVVLIHASDSAMDKLKALGRIRQIHKDTEFAEKGETIVLSE